MNNKFKSKPIIVTIISAVALGVVAVLVKVFKGGRWIKIRDCVNYMVSFFSYRMLMRYGWVLRDSRRKHAFIWESNNIYKGEILWNF